MIIWYNDNVELFHFFIFMYILCDYRSMGLASK